MAHFRAIYDTLSDGQVINSEVVTDNYNGDALSCSQLETSITSLDEDSTKLKRAQCGTVLPTPPPDYVTQYRSCSAINVVIQTEN